MDKEQTVFDQLTLSNFQKWSSTALKTFNNNNNGNNDNETEGVANHKRENQRKN